MIWFKSKQRNRRLSRGHVLDVKMRSDQLLAARIRLGALTVGVLFGTLFGLYLLWRIGETILNRLVYENPAFAIQHIEVQTDGEIAPEQLRRWAGVRLGANLLALDLARVKRDLELVTTISSASVERRLPNTLRIRVTEREPVAQVNVLRARPAGGVEVVVFHLDIEGYVMVPLDPRLRTTALNQLETPLPVLTGVKPAELMPGRRVESPQARAALQLVSEFGCSPMAGLVDLRRIDVGSSEVLVATTGQGAEITFGLQDLPRQLRRWREIHDLAQRMHKGIATLDLAVSNNIPARWLEAAALPPASPAPLKPLRSKKKNV